MQKRDLGEYFSDIRIQVPKCMKMMEMKMIGDHYVSFCSYATVISCRRPQSIDIVSEIGKSASSLGQGHFWIDPNPRT